MQQRIIVKNPQGAIVYSTNSLADAERVIRNHEINGLPGFHFDFENVK